MRGVRWAAVLIGLWVCVSVTGDRPAQAAERPPKTGIVLVAFGILAQRALDVLYLLSEAVRFILGSGRG